MSHVAFLLLVAFRTWHSISSRLSCKHNSSSSSRITYNKPCLTYFHSLFSHLIATSLCSWSNRESELCNISIQCSFASALCVYYIPEYCINSWVSLSFCGRACIGTFPFFNSSCGEESTLDTMAHEISFFFLTGCSSENHPKDAGRAGSGAYRRSVCGWTRCPAAWLKLTWRLFCRQTCFPQLSCCQRWRTQERCSGWVSLLAF